MASMDAALLGAYTVAVGVKQQEQERCMMLEMCGWSGRAA